MAKKKTPAPARAPKKAAARWDRFNDAEAPNSLDDDRLAPDPVPAPKPKRAPAPPPVAPSIAAAAETLGKDPRALPQLEVWERRLINPVQRGSRLPKLKQKGFTLRIIDTSLPGRYHEAIHDQGWIPLDIRDLHDPSEVAGLTEESRDGYVRTGPKGIYLWMKMPTHVFDAIARRKVEIGQTARRSPAQNRQRTMAAAEAKMPGGAEAIARLRGPGAQELIERIDMDPGDLEADLPTADGPVSRSELL